MQTVEIAGIQVPVFDNEPGWIPETNLVLTPTTRHNLQKILYPLMHGYNLLLVGDAGVGKNALIYYINQIRKHPTLRYSFNEDTLPEDLVGAYRIDPLSHAFVWADGPLAHAMRTGATFVADEMNLCPPEVLKRFTSVFTDRYLQLLEGDSSRIQAGGGFNFVATQNPAEGFEGRKNLPREIQKYFATVYIDSYPEAELIEILTGLHPYLDHTLVEAIVHVNHTVERLVVDRSIGQRDLERFHFNIRNLNRLARRLAAGAEVGAAEIRDIYFRPFRREEDHSELDTAIKEIWDTQKYAGSTKVILPENWQNLDQEIEIHINSKTRELDIGRVRLKSNNFIDAPDKAIDAKPEGTFIADVAGEFSSRMQKALSCYPPVDAVRSTLEAMARGLQHGENILLECDPDVEPEDHVRFFADVLGKRLTVITLSRGMHTGDVLGGLKPAGHGRAAGQSDAVEWVDGPLTTAVRRGDFILLKGLEAAGPELVEKLNMLLDDARALGLPPESGETEPLKLTRDARIFALKYYRTQRSVPSISRAFRNRFSAIVVPPLEDSASLHEIACVRLGIDDGQARLMELAGILVEFHLFIKERARKREIGSANLQPYQYGLTNLKRMSEHIRAAVESLEVVDTEEVERTIQEILFRAAGVAYLNEISDLKEREKMARALEALFNKVSLSEILEEYRVAAKKKSLIKENQTKRQIWWDQDEHWRKANTGKFTPRLEGRALKAGIEIDTPETGGQIKEGPDAWYGSDTQGNMGQGEPGAGGGAWGYRTEELYKEFLKKRRALWEYNIGVSLEDFKNIFDQEIQRVTIDFDRLLDPQVDITRRYMSQGSRVDARRYLSYLNGRGDGRVFDKTTVSVEDDKLKGVEIIFAVNKGRRIFNFEYSIATLVSIMSSAIILTNHEIPFGVVGYSDLSNLKENIDLMWFKSVERDFDARAEEDLFYGMARDWHGDTVAEGQVLEELADGFSPDARTRILVMISDFRGRRGKVTIQKDVESRETGEIKTVADDISKRGIIIQGVGVGARAISDVIFQESLQVGGENFSNLPALLATRLTDLIHRHHNAAVL